jgi:hypothetical protein
MIIVVEALDGYLLDGALNLAIRPGMFHLGQPMLDVLFVANPIKEWLKS